MASAAAAAGSRLDQAAWNCRPGPVRMPWAHDPVRVQSVMYWPAQAAPPRQRARRCAPAAAAGPLSAATAAQRPLACAGGASRRGGVRGGEGGEALLKRRDGSVRRRGAVDFPQSGCAPVTPFAGHPVRCPCSRPSRDGRTGTGTSPAERLRLRWNASLEGRRVGGSEGSEAACVSLAQPACYRPSRWRGGAG